MDARLGFWTFSLLLAATSLGVSFWGVAAIRRNDIETHRKRMKLAAWLIVAFVASYGFKLGLLGREELASWGSTWVTVLRVHQFFIAVMLGSGLYSLAIAHKTLSKDAEVRETARKNHRRSGHTAIGAFALAWLMSAITYFGMWQRLG